MYALAEAMEETPRESALQAGARPGAARGRGGQAHPVLHLSDAQELWGCRPRGQGLSLGHGTGAVEVGQALAFREGLQSRNKSREGSPRRPHSPAGGPAGRSKFS